MRFIYGFFAAIGDFPRYLFSRMNSLDRVFGAVLPTEFISGWFTSRRYRELLLGLPALVGLVALFGFSVYALFLKEPPELGYLTESANAARSNGDDAVADLFLRKAAMAGSGSMRDRYNQALLLLQAKRNNEAMDIVMELSPEDGLGYKDARVLLSRFYTAQLNELVRHKNPDQQNFDDRLILLERIEKQCRLIVDEEPKNLFALEKLVQVNLDRKDVSTAITFLERLAEVAPASNLLYSKLLYEQGDKEEARVKCEKAIAHFAKSYENPDLTDEQKVGLRLQIATSYAVIEEYKKGVAVLMVKGDVPPNETVRSALGELFFLWSESIRASSDLKDVEATESLAHKLDLLDKSLKLRPNDPRVLNRIALIAGTDSEAGKKARDAMKRVLATGNASAVVHFVLGVSAMMEGDTDLSFKHMELANRESPNTPVTLNNMAFLILAGDAPDYPKALKLVEKAIELKRDVNAFYDTRGRIYLGLERWSEAVTDLEKALKANVGDKLTLHKSLATAYTKLGLNDLAEIHQEKTAELQEVTGQ